MDAWSKKSVAMQLWSRGSRQSKEVMWKWERLDQRQWRGSVESQRSRKDDDEGMARATDVCVCSKDLAK